MAQVTTFSEFSDEEVLTGYSYAQEKVGVPVDFAALRRIANEAGFTRLARQGFTPRQAASQALWAYERRNGPMTERREESYIRAVAKMLSERNKKTQAKRERETLAEEAKVASHDIERAHPLDEAVQRDLFEATKAGVH
jgi:hypothetical protein